MTTQNEKTDYLSEWPAHYYEIEDINERERILKLAIEQKLDPAGDEKRLLVLKKRFGEKQAEKRADHFLHAWMMIQATGAGGVSFFQKKDRKKNSAGIFRSWVSRWRKQKMWRRNPTERMPVDMYLRKSGKILHILILLPVPGAGHIVRLCLGSFR